MYPEDSYPAPQNECGIDTSNDNIYGGQVTELDEYPWLSLLGYLTRKLLFIHIQLILKM